MNITVIGASAGIGRAVVALALSRGHTVTALARNPEPLPEHPRLRKLPGDATSVAALRAAVGGAEAVIITIGARGRKTPELFVRTGQALLQAAAETGLTAPVLVVTGFGAGASRAYLNLFMRAVIGLLLPAEYADKTRLEELLAASPLRWQIVRPGMLTNGPATGRYRVLPDLQPGLGIRRLSRADVADFLLRQAEHPTLLGKYPALSG
jgi:putative NADH-flavin reductase